MSRCPWFAVAIAVFFVAQQASFGATDQDWATRLREEAPAAWEELRQFYSHLECALVKTETDTYEAHPELNGKVRLRLDVLIKGGSLRAVTSEGVRLAGKPPPTPANFDKIALCAHGDFSFKLTHRLEPAAWVLELTGGRRESEDFVVFVDWAEFVWAPWWVGGVSIGELMQKPGFQVTSVEGGGASDSPRVTVKFTYTPSNEEVTQRSLAKQLWALCGGTFTFAPQEHWSVIESELIIQPYRGVKTDAGTTVQKFGVEYGDRVGKFLVPKRVKQTTTSPGDLREVVAEFEKFVSREIDDKEFTLAAFGLPDPRAAAGAPTRWWLWAALGGGGLLALAAGFVWLRQRARR